jgi:protein ImuB
MKRILCLWFPLWPIQRLRHKRPELRTIPLVVYVETRGKAAVASASPQAQQHGIRIGMPLAEAKAICAKAHFDLHDAEADVTTLRRLALWCQRYAPWIAVERPDSLILDITGCGHLFGGEEELTKQAVEQLTRLGFVAKAAVAQSARVAWAVARYQSSNVLIVAAGAHGQALDSLPVEALRLGEECLRLLWQFDIRTIGQLRQLPRASLPARFGADILQRLDQGLGEIPEPFTWERARAPVEASWTFECPCSDRHAVELVFERLLKQMLTKLQPQHLGIQRLRCTFQVLELEPYGFTVGLLHANDSLGYLMELLRLHLDRVRLPAEITGATLRADLIVPLEFRQGRLFADATVAERWRRVPALVEVLSNRLGKQAVLRPRLLPEAQPELAWSYEPWLEQEVSAPPKSWHKEKATGALIRPLLLESSPIPIAVIANVDSGAPLRFTWQGQTFAVARHWGLERIETGWWRGCQVRRDYYLVETTAGERFWLFRETAKGAWYFHGIFA